MEARARRSVVDSHLVFCARRMTGPFAARFQSANPFCMSPTDAETKQAAPLLVVDDDEGRSESLREVMAGRQTASSSPTTRRALSAAPRELAI